MNPIDHSFEITKDIKEQSHTTIKTFNGLPSTLLNNASNYDEEDVTKLVLQNITFNSTKANKENNDSQTERKQNQHGNITKGQVSKFIGKAKKEEKKGKVNDAQVDISGVYNFKDSGIGDSYLIGTDYIIYDQDYVETWANGLVGGLFACPLVLEIPGELTNKNGITKPVEIIGIGAFNPCGNERWSGKTKMLKVPRQVKIIKEKGLSGMCDLEKFEIEAGSHLETIESSGLEAIGSNTWRDPNKRTETLILPSNLSSIYKDGINYCNLFHTIIYCGSHHLSNSSAVENISPETIVKVTSQYPSNENIFGRSPKRDSQTEAEAEIECMKMGFIPKPSPSASVSPSQSLSSSQSPSPSPSPSQSQSPVPLKYRCSPQKNTFSTIPSLICALLPSQFKQKKDIRERLKLKLLL